MKPLADDARHELTVAAAARERRNRPMGLVAGAGALLVIAGIAAAAALASRASAAGELRAQAGARERIGAQVEELTGLRAAAAAAEGGDAGAPLGALIVTARLDELATSVGLKEKPAPPRVTDVPKGKIRVKEFLYQNVRSDNLKGLLAWLQSAPGTVPGLEVYRLDLRAEPTAWSMTVTFRRWERAE